MKKRIILVLSFVLLHLSMGMAQDVYTKEFNNPKLERKAVKWMKKGKWREGFMVNPDASVNATDFYVQYQRNPEQWQALFRWMATTDLKAIPKGKHPIEGTKLVASVEDSKNGPLEKRQSESHYHHIDFQYVVSGVERFGLIEHNSSTPNCKWREDVIHYDYDREKARFIDSSPDRFFIFFPQDWHIAKVENDTDDQDIRVIVIKVDYIDD